MTRLAASFPVIGELRLLDADGKILSRANANGAMPLQVSSPAGQDDTLDFPLRAQPGGPVLASLRILPDEHLVAAAVRARILDAATVVAAELVVAIELPILLTLLMDRAFAVHHRGQSGEPVGRSEEHTSELQSIM